MHFEEERGTQDEYALCLLRFTCGKRSKDQYYTLEVIQHLGHVLLLFCLFRSSLQSKKLCEEKKTLLWANNPPLLLYRGECFLCRVC